MWGEEKKEKDAHDRQQKMKHKKKKNKLQLIWKKGEEARITSR